MLRSVSLLGLSILLLTSLAAAATAQVQPISPDEAQEWLRYTVPLPKTTANNNKR